MAVDHSGLLILVLFALSPLLAPQTRLSLYSWNRLLPNDAISRMIELVLRVAGAGAITALVLGLSGIHKREQPVERIGRGARIVMLLDRSSSMDNSFAGKTPGGAEESKAGAARRLLARFVGQRPDDLFGVASFSTGPMFVMPLTDNRDAIVAAIDTLILPGLGFTHIAKGLFVALSIFPERPLEGSRILLLVSDGAAAIDSDSEAKLRRIFQDSGTRIYWLFLRTANSPGIFDLPQNPADDNAQVRPERYLHLFFVSLKVPYKAYEAENPEALQQAIADIDRLERLPLKFTKRLPRENLDKLCYAIALACVGILICGKWAEVRGS
ncbi:MAG: VWA domain-containing protein [Methylococcaceae bacterium]|nr:VWA domain-containing protein [Methylococcaceae bacterium]